MYVCIYIYIGLTAVSVLAGDCKIDLKRRTVGSTAWAGLEPLTDPGPLSVLLSWTTVCFIVFSDVLCTRSS